MLKKWNVFVRGRCIGQVNESSEELARCAALYHFGLDDEEWAESKGQRELLGPHIPPEAEFSVMQA